MVCFGSFWNKSVCFSCLFIHFRFVLVHVEANLFVQLFQCTFSVCFGSFWNKTVSFSCFHIHFWFVSVYFETNLFVLVVSIYIRNTETKRNKIFIGFENEPKQKRNRSCFGYFRFEPKFIFIRFMDTLVHTEFLMLRFFQFNTNLCT